MEAKPQELVGRELVFEQRARRDKLAFAMVVAFGIQMYTIPGEWLAWAAPFRFALVFSVGAAGMMLLRRIARSEPLYFDGVRGLAVIGFLVLTLASTLWSVAPEVTAPYGIELAKLVAIFIVIINVVNTPRRLMVVCAALVLACAVTSTGVIIWYHNGLDLSEGFRARWFGVYNDPNHMAETIGIILPLAAAFVIRKQTPMWLRAACAISAALAVIAIVESHSRGGFIGLCAAMGIWAFREKQHRKQALIAGVVLAVGMAVFSPSSFWERNNTLENFHEDESAMGRVYAWHVGSAISMDRPMLGVGAGAFRYAWPLYSPPEAKKAFVAHNIFVDVIGELGWVGLFLFLTFVGGSTAAAFAAGEDAEVGWLGRAISAAIVGFLICNCFSGNPLFAHTYVLFALAATSDRIRRTLPEEIFRFGAKPAPVPFQPAAGFAGAAKV